MRKIIICLLLTSTLVFIKKTAIAQAGSSTSLSAGFEIGLPPDTYKQELNFEVDGGLNAKLELPIFSALHLTITGGYFTYQANDGSFSKNGSNLTDFNYIPVKAGLRFYLPKSFRYVFFEGEAGEAFVVNSPAASSFIYAGGFGGIIPLKGRSSFEISTRYENGYQAKPHINFPDNTIAVRFAYRYQFK